MVEELIVESFDGHQMLVGDGHHHFNQVLTTDRQDVTKKTGEEGCKQSAGQEVGWVE